MSAREIKYNHSAEVLVHRAVRDNYNITLSVPRPDTNDFTPKQRGQCPVKKKRKSLDKNGRGSSSSPDIRTIAEEPSFKGLIVQSCVFNEISGKCEFVDRFLSTSVLDENNEDEGYCSRLSDSISTGSRDVICDEKEPIYENVGPHGTLNLSYAGAQLTIYGIYV